MLQVFVSRRCPRTKSKSVPVPRYVPCAIASFHHTPPRTVSKTCCIRFSSAWLIPIVYLRADRETQNSPPGGRPGVMNSYGSWTRLRNNGVLRRLMNRPFKSCCMMRCALIFPPLYLRSRVGYRSDAGTLPPRELVAYPMEADPAIVAMC
jgi:hypothetical protein